MTRPRPPHLHHEKARSRRVWYVRVGHGKRHRLTAPYGSPEFWRQYHAAVAQTPAGEVVRPRHVAHTIGWLIERYRESAAWASLAQASRRQRENIFRHLVEDFGREPITALTKATVIRSMDKRRETPEAANMLLKALRGVFKWAVNADLVKTDPTEGVSKITVKTTGFPVWTDADMEAFRQKWPVGTRERLAFDLLLHTGLRRGDVVQLGRQHIKDGVISIKTEKTGDWVHIPVNAVLERGIGSVPKSGITFIVGANGAPMSKEGFGNWFGKACRLAGVAKSAHGLRKADAVAVAEAGASEQELMARFGWKDQQMASLYTKSANRKRLAIEAGRKREQALPEQDFEAPAQNPNVLNKKEK